MPSFKKWSPLLVALLALGILSGCSRTKDAQENKASEILLTHLCVVYKNAKRVTSPDGVTVFGVDWPNGSCVELLDFSGQKPHSIDELNITFPEVPPSKLRDFDRFSVVVCPGNRSTITGIPGLVRDNLPHIDTLGPIIQDACNNHAGPALHRRSGWGFPPAPPGAMPLGVQGAPPSSGISCASSTPNPYAQSNRSSYDNYKAPANDAREELSQELSAWIGGGAAIGAMLGSAKGEPTKGFSKGVIVGALGKFLDLAINSESNAENIGTYMWEQAKWEANAAVESAIADEARAKAAADDAAKSAQKDPSNARVQQAAADAAQAAKRATRAAQSAREAATRTAAQFKGAGPNSAAAVAAAAEARSAADEADKKRNEAARKGDSQPEDGPTQGGPTEQRAPESSDKISGCDSLRNFVWSCEQVSWETYSCQEFLWKLNHCAGDLSVIYPTEDGYKCTGVGPETDPSIVVKVAQLTCQRLVHPAPGQDPCSLINTQVRGGVIDHNSGCDPSIAFTERGGCTVAPQVVIEVKQFCPPGIPKAPPPPCGDPEGPPLPPAIGLKSILEQEGPVSIGSTGGNGTLSSRNSQLVLDQGGGYRLGYLFYGFESIVGG